jgi:acetyl-CoA carboxylase biotin carboxyl carrier protein
MTPKPTRRSVTNGHAPTFSIEEVKELVALIDGTNLTHVAWTRGGENLVIRRGAAHVVAAPVFAATPVQSPTHPPHASAFVAPPVLPAPSSAARADGKPPGAPGTIVGSPLVGTFYRAPSPDSPPFTDVGKKVKKGQTLCIVEAMKLMNEIEAEIDGTVAEIFVQNATPVEFGEQLFRIVPG